MTSSTRPGLAGCLASRGLAPSPGSPAWPGRAAGQQVVRALHEPGDVTWLHCLDGHRRCLYEAELSPGTPESVVIAAIEAVVALAAARPAPGTGARQGRRPGARDS
jgi:hypothetical protein